MVKNIFVGCHVARIVRSKMRKPLYTGQIDINTYDEY